MRLMLLLFIRTSELIETPWNEIDLERGEWVIPWRRMKRGRRRIKPNKTDHYVCMLNGGVHGRTADGRRTTTRAVTGIDQDLKVNRALWILAEQMQVLKH